MHVSPQFIPQSSATILDTQQLMTIYDLQADRLVFGMCVSRWVFKWNTPFDHNEFGNANLIIDWIYLLHLQLLCVNVHSFVIVTSGRFLIEIWPLKRNFNSKCVLFVVQNEIKNNNQNISCNSIVCMYSCMYIVSVTHYETNWIESNEIEMT